MANILAGLNKAIIVVGKGVNEAKKAADKALWGSVNNTTAVPAPDNPALPPKKTKVGSFIQSGLFNTLDVLLSVDLCNIMTYLVSTTITTLDTKKKRSETPTLLEKRLYDLQDKAILARQAIDTFYAAPANLAKSLQNPNTTPAPAPGTEAPSALVGTAKSKYDFGILSTYLSSVFGYTQIAQGVATGVTEIVQEGLLDEEVAAALSIIPGVRTNLNAVQDFLGLINTYADFRTIPDQDFQKLLTKLDNIRAVCSTIENLSLPSAVGLVQQFSSVDIRSQVALLDQYVDTKKIIPTLKQINNTLRSFIGICRATLNYLRIIRGFVKIAIILIRIYKYIANVIANIPAPLAFVTYNVVAKLENAKTAAKDNSSKLEDFLKQVNVLLGIMLSVIIYLQQNTQALLQRLAAILAILEGCDSTKDSEVVKQLRDTYTALETINTEFTQVIADYNQKNETTYGKYTIQIIEEELADEGIVNKRRRGVALDAAGRIVVQSDLTFATDDRIITEEVRLKLIAAGLIPPEEINADAIIIESLRYLGNDTIDANDIELSTASVDIGLEEYIRQQPGSEKFRKRVRKALQKANQDITAKIAEEKSRAGGILGR